MSIVADLDALVKIRRLFDSCTSNGKLTLKEASKFFLEMGFQQDIFCSDFSYYLGSTKKSLSFDECIQFLDFLLTSKQTDNQIMEAFKMLDRNGIGQINTSQLLSVIKKNMGKSQYDMYSQILSSYGPFINYMEFFTKTKKNT